MTTFQKISLLLLRLSLGWIFLYSAVTKLMNPSWSAAGYIKGAKTFVGMYDFFLRPDILPITNFMNEWGQLLLAIALILGVGIRLAAVGGVLMMLMYYFVVLDFPYPSATALIVDQHIIYALVFVALAAFRAGRAYGLEQWCSKLPICKRYPKLRSLLG